MIKFASSVWWNRIVRRFERLYGEDGVRAARRFNMMIGRYGVGMDPHARPQTAAEAWDQTDSVLITYADMVRSGEKAPLAALRDFLAARLSGVVSTVHLLPFFPYSSDDGFSVIDYRAVDPDSGEWRDVRALGQDFKLMFDLVLNHVSRHSAWYRDYVNGIAPARHYFIEADPKDDLSAVVRPRARPLLTEARTRGGTSHLWATFSDDQLDVDFSNPDVLFEFLDILLLYISMGARIVRLDAIAYLWKEIGTTCIHLPQTHEVVRIMRELVELVAPGALILTETNVPHEENISYFGDGDEAHMVYQFSLPPLLLHTLLKGDSRALTGWAAGLGDPPEGCTFFNFTASHDGVGVRPLEGLVSPEELSDLVQAVRDRGGHVSTKTNADGTESPYELNITYFDALGDPGDGESDTHVARFLLSQAIALALRGIPGIYFHSLTATRNYTAGVGKTGRARTINRMKWEASALERMLENPASAGHKVFERYVRLLTIRRGRRAFHPFGRQQVLDLSDHVFALERVSPEGGERLLALHNVTDAPVEVDWSDRSTIPGRRWRELISDTAGRGSSLTLAPYQAAWILPSDERATKTVSKKDRASGGKASSKS